MDFREWYEKEWNPRYHPLISSIRELPAFKELWDVRFNNLKERAESILKELMELRDTQKRQGERIFGNGKPGFVREEIEAAVSKLESNLALQVKAAVSELLDEWMERQEEKNKAALAVATKRAESWQAKAWDLFKIILSLAQAILLLYLGAEYFSK